ncbi:MAG: hypothetical protein A2W00_06350 [Candidatus Eisenbacteria bacterium RBG_16_71_46]|nr:MAG: hypothetical protein A2W00_06350 [Candidatus Eisenbacteria bacterium RBG_16_71_46]
MMRRVLGGLWGAGLLAWAACAAAAPAPQAPPPAIAKVGDRSVLRKEFDLRYAQAMADYRARAGQDLSPELEPIVRRQVLEGMIRIELLAIEAQRRGLQVSEADAEQEFRKDPVFRESGEFNPAKYEAMRMANPGAFAAALHEVRARLSAQRMRERIEREHAPEEAALRARLERALSEADIEALVLRYEDFGGDAPEPRERDVLAEYADHAADYRRREQVMMSVAFFDQPPIDPAKRDDPAALRAWDRRMRQAADSALAAVQAGATLEQAASTHATVRTRVTATPDEFPAFWQGDARQRAAVFGVPVGRVLPQPVHSNPGWLLVRVDAKTPAHVAPLAEVALGIRAQLRARARLAGEEPLIRALYAARRDSLRGVAVKLRVAWFDTLSVSVKEPSPSDLDRYHRGHLADYSSFDAATGAISTIPFEQVRDEIRTRWLSEQRALRARSLAEQLQKTWGSGRRDARLERQAAEVREVGPLLLGSAIPAGAAGPALNDSIAARGGAPGAGVVVDAGGALVFLIEQRLEDFLPPYEQVRERLAPQFATQRERGEERGARALFDADPRRFALGNMIYLSRLVLDPLRPLDVPLTRAEVERYHRDHIERYSAAEQMHASHILISPKGLGTGQDQAARVQAEAVLRRVRAGENFAELARQYSDDEGTRESGGDLQTFGRGAMLDAFDRAAFSLRPGDVSHVVKTEVGYHIIKCLDYYPTFAPPLAEVYSNVGYDAAKEKADAIVAQRADSLFRSLKSPSQARAAVREGIVLIHNQRQVGEPNPVRELDTYFHTLDTLAPGTFYPGVIRLRSGQYVITWVDSIGPPASPTWERARDRVMAEYQRTTGERAMRAKCAELDSMLRTGWSFDSLGALWGGLLHAPSVQAGQGLDKYGGVAEIDSLLFGARHGPALTSGGISGWVALRPGLARIRLNEVHAPSATQLSARTESERRVATQRNLYEYFEELKRRYPVRILDRALRDVTLPPPPSSL